MTKERPGTMGAEGFTWTPPLRDHMKRQPREDHNSLAEASVP